jgi:hypothetical protein
MTKTYQQLCDDLVQLAVKYELSRREHDRAIDECKRARARLPPGVSIMVGGTDDTLELALAMERASRDVLAKAEGAYKDAAKVITAELEARNAKMAAEWVPQ